MGAPFGTATAPTPVDRSVSLCGPDVPGSSREVHARGGGGLAPVIREAVDEGRAGEHAGAVRELAAEEERAERGDERRVQELHRLPPCVTRVGTYTQRPAEKLVTVGLTAAKSKSQRHPRRHSTMAARRGFVAAEPGKRRRTSIQALKQMLRRISAAWGSSRARSLCSTLHCSAAAMWLNRLSTSQRALKNRPARKAPTTELVDPFVPSTFHFEKIACVQGVYALHGHDVWQRFGVWLGLLVSTGTAIHRLIEENKSVSPPVAKQSNCESRNKRCLIVF